MKYICETWWNEECIRLSQGLHPWLVDAAPAGATGTSVGRQSQVSNTVRSPERGRRPVEEDRGPDVQMGFWRRQSAIGSKKGDAHLPASGHVHGASYGHRLPALARGRERWAFDERALGRSEFVAAFSAQSDAGHLPTATRVDVPPGCLNRIRETRLSARFGRSSGGPRRTARAVPWPRSGRRAA